MRRIWILGLLGLLLVPRTAHALLSRHNEEGLSPTHSYKRSGEEGVVSNLNGNLVVTSTPVELGGAPLGVSLVRTWNSHWRDPLFSFEYDMDHNQMDMSDSTKRHPKYNDQEVNGGDLDIGGFATRRVQKYGSLTEVPRMWSFAQSVSLSLVQEAASEAITQAINQKYAVWLNSFEVRQQQARVTGTPFQPTSDDLKTEAKIQNENLAAAQALGATLYLFTRAKDDFNTLSNCGDTSTTACVNAMYSMTDGFAGVYINSSLNEAAGTTGVPFLTIADMTYNVASGNESPDDAAWQVGTMAGQSLAASIVGGGVAGGVAGIAVAAAIQMTRLYINLQADWAKTFDVGFVNVNPWALGVNGYIGMIGTNEDAQLQKAQPRFFRQWKDWRHFYRPCGKSLSCPDSVLQTVAESRHPMPDLQLVGADGGALRFILSDDSARTVKGRRWVSYVPLSNADHRQIYYCLPLSVPDSENLGTVPTQGAKDSSRALDSTGFYLVKEPDGTQVVFGSGFLDKGLVPDQVGYHTYWAVPSKFRYPTGDSVFVQRDALHHPVAAWDARTGRGARVSGDTIISGVLNSSGSLTRGVDTVWSSSGAHTYIQYSGKMGDVNDSTRVLNWEARRISPNQIDTTRFSYSNGDLVSISYANGSRSAYSYPGQRNTTLDGFVGSSIDYPDQDSANYFLERDYTYEGWGASRPQGLRTAVHTLLQQPDYVVNPSLPWRKSETTDWYNFAPMLESKNINLKLQGFKGLTTVQRLNNTVHDTDRYIDSLEFKTSRFQLVAEYHGAGSPGMTRTQYVYNGDQKIAKIESRGLSASFDPKITAWDYDGNGSVVRERVCPKDISDTLNQRIARLPNMPPMSLSCPEVSTVYGVQHRNRGEFWNITRDSSIVIDSSGTYRVVVENAHPNPQFLTDSLYRLGVQTSKRLMRKGDIPAGSTVFNATDSTLIGDSTEYQDWRLAANSTPFMRPVRQRTWLGGVWQPTQDITYDDADKRPGLPFRSSRYLSTTSVSVEETSYDSIYQLLPTRSRFYTAPQSPGVTPSGNVLDTTRTVDVDHGWVLAKKDPGGHVQTTQYDRSGRPLKIVNPDGGTTSYSYVDRQQPTSAWRFVPGYQSGYPSQKTVAIRETDPSGVTTEARFDGLGRQVAVRVLARGADTTVTDTARQHTTLFSYNIFDKLQWKRDPDAREEFHDYDGTGRLTASRTYLTPSVASAKSPAWESDYTYQDNLRTLVEQDALGTRTTFHWDALGRDTLIERDADTSAFYLRVGGLASAGVMAPAATTKIQVHQAYDNLGNLVRLADPKGLVETRHYDERNRMNWTVYPDDLRHAVGYDLASRAVLDSLQMVTHPESLTVRTSSYDALDRPLTETFGTNLPENTTYAWDSFGSVTDPGRLLGVTRGTGVVASYTYDPMGRRSSRALSLPSFYSASQSWTYDPAGSPTRSDLPGTAHLSTGYDAFHRLGTVSVVHGTDSIPVLHDVSYRPNDLLAGYGLGPRVTATETYEPQRPVLTQSVITKSVTNDTLYLQRMTWDGAGNVAGMRRNLGDSLGFDVDHLYQLREVHYPDGQALKLGYDQNGNRTKFTHPMGKGMTDTFALNGNRVTGASTARKGWTQYRTDSRGNISLTAEFVSAADSGDLTKAWRVVETRFNKRNELARVRVINRQNGLDTTWLRFDYGEDGNRILSAMGRGSDTSSWQVTHKWVYDGSVVVADSGSDHGWNWHAYNGLNRVAEATDSAGHARVRYVLTDHQGTVQALLSDTGAMLGHWIWDPWGNIEESWSLRTTELLYQGKPYETALGQWYFNARWYSAERGEFTGRDAVLQYWSPYGYVGNQPFTGFDPTGEQDYSSMAGMDFSGMASFAFGQSTGNSADNLALQVNSTIMDFSVAAPDIAGSGSSYAAYGAFGLALGAGASAALFPPLALPLAWGSAQLMSVSTGLAVAQTGFHLEQYVSGDESAGRKLVGDAISLGSAKFGGDLGGSYMGGNSGFSIAENKLFEGIGESGGNAFQAAFFDGQDVVAPNRFTRTTTLFMNPDALSIGSRSR